jgi:hypothetical protein
LGFSIAARQQPCKSRPGSQEKCKDILGLRAIDGAPKTAFCLRFIAIRQSEITFEQVQAGVGPMLPVALGGSPGLGESDGCALEPLCSAVKVSKDPQIVRQPQLGPEESLDEWDGFG